MAKAPTGSNAPLLLSPERDCRAFRVRSGCASIVLAIGVLMGDEGEGVNLWLRQERPEILLPTECVRSPAERAAARGARFPTIPVELPGQKTKRGA
jgi:hypothetical protein